MSTKKRHFYDKVWHELRELCNEKQAYVSAGEFALHFGVARSTAQRYLKDMLRHKAIVAIKVKARNGVMGTYYATGDNLRGNESAWFLADMNPYVLPF